VVSTTLGAEGLDGISGQHLLIADDPSVFADSVLRVLADRTLADRLGSAGRALVIDRFSWQGVAESLDAFFRQALARRDSTPSTHRGSKN